MLVKLMESTHQWFAFKNEVVNLETNDSTSICNKTLGEGTEVYIIHLYKYLKFFKSFPKFFSGFFNFLLKL